MHGVAGLLVYLFGVSAIVSIELIGLTALLSPVDQTPSLGAYITATHNFIPSVARKFNLARVTPKPTRKVANTNREQ